MNFDLNDADRERVFFMLDQALCKEVLNHTLPTKKLVEMGPSLKGLIWGLWTTLKTALLSMFFTIKYMYEFDEEGKFYEAWYKEHIHPNRQDLHGFFGID